LRAVYCIFRLRTIATSNNVLVPCGFLFDDRSGSVTFDEPALAWLWLYSVRSL